MLDAATRIVDFDMRHVNLIREYDDFHAVVIGSQARMLSLPPPGYPVHADGSPVTRGNVPIGSKESCGCLIFPDTSIISSEKHMGNATHSCLYMDQQATDTGTCPAEKNRQKLKELARFAGSYSKAAHLIAEQTQRPLSVDSIKAWTCNSAAKRARPCPEWAIVALERRLNKPEAGPGQSNNRRSE